MPPVSMQQIRQVMLCETDSSDSDSDQDARPAAARRAARSAGSRQQGQRARAAAQGGDGSRASQVEDRIDMRLLFLKRMHGGTLPAFDDRHPDPGCAFEAMSYRQNLDPVFVPKSHETLQVHMVHQYDPETPHIRRLLEEVRESHWKLTAPKGFASLKGIPELQQLLAYTAADVAHYAVDSQGLGQPGSIEGQFKHDHHTVRKATEGVDTHVLYGKDSMIGQLVPGLRLCLAAEVATGLLCDSQPLPPDTPEHGSALLLFLAAALKQAEQECLRYAKPHGIEWEPGSSPAALKPLLELCLCLDPQAALQLLQQVAAGSNGSSSSSECAAGSNGSSSSNSQFCPDAGPPRDYAQGNVLLAALEVSTLLMQGSSTSSSNASKLVPAGEESSSTISSAGWTLRFAGPALQPLVQKLVQQQQRWEGAAVAAGAVQSLVQLIDNFCFQHVSSAAPSADQQRAAAAEPTAAAEPATALAAEPAAATAGSVHSCNAAAADDVAWQVSVLTGAAALMLLAPLRDSSEPQQQQEQAAAALPGLCPVRAALLFCAIEGLYFGVQQTLWLGVSAAPCGCTCSTCAAAANLQQQQQQDMSPERLRSDITSQILSVLQLAQGLRVPNTGAAGNVSGSSSSSSGSQQQQQWRQGQEQLRRYLAFAQTAAATEDRAAAASLMHFALANGFSKAQFEVLQHLYSLQHLTTWAVLCPQAWLSYLFLTYEQEQLSPVCLQQGAATTAAAAAAAGAGVVNAAEGASQGAAGEDGLEEHRAAWTKLQPVLAERCLGALAADLQQRQAAAGSSTQHKQQQQQQGSSSAAGGDSAAGGGASQQPASQSPSSHHADFIAELAAGPDTSQLLSDMTDALLTHQRFWVRVVRRLARIDSDFDDYEMLLLDYKKRERERLRAAEREESFRPKKHLRWSDEELAEALELFGEALFRPMNDRSGSGGSGSSSSSSSGGREPAGSSEQTLPPGGCGLNKDWACPVCAVEQKAGAFIADLAASTSASSSSSGSSGSRECSGLYGSFPVSWSDPYLMRRLLWDLLGRVKPTAQAWFKQYFHMCPHRITVWAWHALVMSLARHLWAPPGPWGPQQQQQMALLLPRTVSSNRRPSHKAEENAAARRQYARWCNAGFAHQSSNGAAAAVLSLQVLLSLDPHGARVQPRPELLFYAPAGFHAAVAKTLMQAFRLPPSLLPAGQCCGSADNTAAGSSTDEGSSSEQASNQQQEPAGDEPHYLQAWGDTLFPAWYMWWHIGLLAYQQQQQQQPKQTQSAAAAAGSSAAFVSPPVSSATQQLPAAVSAPALSGAAGGKGGSSVCGSSVGGSSCEPVSMQELYNNPDARLFAVGYAARHISSGAQLHRLLSNPPLARALQSPVDSWILEQECEAESCCCCCCGMSLLLHKDLLVHYCDDCAANTCSAACHESHRQQCEVSPVTRLLSAHRWRVLDLLRPASQAPQQQQPSAEPAAAAAPSSTSLPPAAANCALPSILQQWANEAQDPAVMAPLFQVHSGAPLGGAVSRSERLAQAGAAAAAAAGDAGEKSDDDSDDFDVQDVLSKLKELGLEQDQYTITRERGLTVVQLRDGARARLAAAGQDRPGTPEYPRRWGGGRSYGPAPHAGCCVGW